MKNKGKLIGNILIGLCWGLLPSELWMSLPKIGRVAQSLSQKLDASQAKIMIEEEKRKLGIKENVNLVIYENQELDMAGLEGFSTYFPTDNSYIIGADPKYLDRILIRHELYHIFRKDMDIASIPAAFRLPDKKDITAFLQGDGKNEIFRYRLLMEPRACLYSVSGMRL